MNRNRQYKNSILFSILSVLIFALTACKNPALTTNLAKDFQNEQGKAYVVVTIKDNDASRRVSSVLTASLFSDITFSGSDGNGHTVSETAASLSELGVKQICVDTGTWTFNLEAYIGKTSTSAGEKYVATKTGVVIAPGENHLSMKLQVDPVSFASPSAHPGNWEVTLQFPSDSIDEVVVSLFDYSTFAVEGASLSSLTPLFTKTLTKGTNFTATGAQSVKVSESSRATGNYIINAEFKTKIQNADGTITKEVLNNWCELMRISPGAKSTGTITLPAADEIYTIIYHIGTGAEWDTSSSVAIPLSYTKNSGDSNGKITLPTGTAFVARQYYDFLGWYEHEDFSGSTVTDFNVSEATDKEFYAKWKEPVYDVYISATGDDTNGDGSKDNPVKTANVAYGLFDDLTATNTDGTFKNTIHIISDYTGTNKISSPWGDGSKNGMYVNFVGEKGKVPNADVTLELDMHACGSPVGPQTFIYIEHDQKMKFSHINFTSNQTYENPNGYGCLFADTGTELSFEDSTIKGYVANGCAGINAKGTVYLKNCEISGNKAIDGDTDASKFWGCAVNVGTGELHISGSVIIKGNQILKADGSGQLESASYNLYIGTNDGGTPVFHPVIIEDAITDSEIWVKLADEPDTFTSGYGTHETVEPSTYFHSDSGMEVRAVLGEARLSAVLNIYVAASPTGNDSSGSGTEASPYESIARAVRHITQSNNTQLDAVIHVIDEVSCNTVIADTAGTGVEQLIANSLTIEGSGTGAALDGNATGTVLELRTTVPVTLKNLTVKNGKTETRGGGLNIDGATVEINNCIIEDNKALIQGGGVYIADGSSLTMNGENSVIRNNRITGEIGSPITPATKKCGAGVHVAQGANFTMNAGTISGNGATDSAGGVYTRGIFTMEGGVITSNKRYNYHSNPTRLESNFTDANNTDNVEVGTPGTFNLKGGKITSENTGIEGGPGCSCGGVCLYATASFSDPSGTATFNMSGGSIEGITSRFAAVYLQGLPNDTYTYNLEFNMTGGSIKGNTSVGTGNSAGAVYLDTCAHFNMSGGEISGNHAALGSGGIFFYNSGDSSTLPTLTLGAATAEGKIKIVNNTVGDSNLASNICLPSSKKITVAGPLKTIAEGYGIGITRSGTFSSIPFTTGFASNNGGAYPAGTSPADIFTSDEGYTIITGNQGEAAFLTVTPHGTIYAPGDYNFTLAASRNSVLLGRAANVTVTPLITRKEPNGNTTELFYNPADQKLYLDSAFLYSEGTNSKVTWSASLWCGAEVEYSTIAAVDTESNANKFTIPALSFENNYTMNVTATYQGYAHNADFAISCTPGYIGSKTPSEAKEVNDIVFSDGSAEPYTSELVLTDEQKEEAVAMIYYTSPTASVDVGVKTLGIGFNHIKRVWTQSGTEALEINCFSSSNNQVLSQVDGAYNLSIISNLSDYSEENYPAVWWASHYGVEINGVSTGWYLPSSQELKAFYAKRSTLNALINKIGNLDTFSITNTDYYWSSYVGVMGDISRLHCRTGALGSGNYNENFWVFAIREF